ncbi:NUDIX hydrolase [Patescibacteria group bacterium]|nr:NUDIX hydrolase [Patescibacteria group bacterium]
MKFLWHKDTNFHHLRPITQIYGVCFNKDGNILILKQPNKEWNIPGGTPELNETPIQALKRELIEEVDVEINKNQMIGYFEVISDKPAIYQLRFACTIKTINKQTVDPANNNVNERKLVKPIEFFDYVKIENYRPMIAEAIKWFEKI